MPLRRRSPRHHRTARRRAAFGVHGERRGQGRLLGSRAGLLGSISKQAVEPVLIALPARDVAGYAGPPELVDVDSRALTHATFHLLKSDFERTGTSNERQLCLAQIAAAT